MNRLELEYSHIENYKLGAKYCRHTMERGGVSIFVQKNLKFTKINTEAYCLDKDIEACALKLKSIFSNIRILALYRAPSGNFSDFLNKLESRGNIQGVLGVRCTPTESHCHRYYIFAFILDKDSSNCMLASRDS
jgi:hypothetical protein